MIIPLLLQIIVLYYISKMYGLRVRIIAMDKYRTQGQQNGYMTWCQIKLYVAALVYLLFLN